MTLRWTNGAKAVRTQPRGGARSGAAGGARAAICDASHACGLAQKPANLLMTMAFFPTSLPARAGRRARRPVAVATQRLRPRLLPIAHTAAAAVLAWYVALAIVPDPRPSFASIAAVISAGRSSGRRARRAAELIGGVVVGLSVAHVVVRVIGVGPLQMGLMVLVAMSTAVVLGGGALLVTEAAVSALLLLAAADPTAATIGPGLSPMRMAEALIGGAIALGVTSVFFPPDPALMVGRAVQSVFAGLGRSLERIAGALEDGDAAGAGRALVAARDIDERIDALDDAFVAARETARLAPPRRRAREQVDRYGRTLAQLDFAVRNTRVLARQAVRLTRAASPASPGRTPRGLARQPVRLTRAASPAPPELVAAVRELAGAVWELAAAYDDPGRSGEVARLARAAAGRAAAAAERAAEPGLVEVAGQVRSTAVDLVRAAELVAADGVPAPEERPTEELLLATT